MVTNTVNEVASRPGDAAQTGWLQRFLSRAMGAGCTLLGPVCLWAPYPAPLSDQPEER